MSSSRPPFLLPGLPPRPKSRHRGPLRGLDVSRARHTHEFERRLNEEWGCPVCYPYTYALLGAKHRKVI